MFILDLILVMQSVTSHADTTTQLLMTGGMALRKRMRAIEGNHKVVEDLAEDKAAPSAKAPRLARMEQRVLQHVAITKDGQALSLATSGSHSVSHNAEANMDGIAARTNQFQGCPTFAVLLTTYNTKDRQPMYMERLQWWLRKTELPLFVVDSAGRGFPPSLSNIRSFKQLKFNQTDILGGHLESATKPELLSLQRAWEAFKEDWSKYDYVVKVTGKYVLPELQSEMKKVHEGNSFIIENFTDHPHMGYLRWVNTEYLGFNAAHMGVLLEKLSKNAGVLEDRLGQLLMTQQYPLQQLGSMMIPAEYRTARGIGDVLGIVLQISD